MNFEFGRTFRSFRQLGGQVRSHLDEGGGQWARVTDAPDLWTVLHSTLSTAVIAVPTELYEFLAAKETCVPTDGDCFCSHRPMWSAQRGFSGDCHGLLRNERNPIILFTSTRSQTISSSCFVEYCYIFLKKLLGGRRMQIFFHFRPFDGADDGTHSMEAAGK